MNSNRFAILAGLAVVVLGGCSADPQSEGPADASSTPMTDGSGSASGTDTDATMADPLASPTAAGEGGAEPQSRAFIDPVTGQMCAPTAAELAALQPAESNEPAVKQRPAQVEGTRLPDGTIRYDMSNQPQVEEKVCVQADGSIGPCPAK